MKRGVVARSRALDLEQPTGSDRDHDVAIVDWDAGPPRQGRTVSEAVVCRFVTGLDIAAILGAGAAAIHLDTSTIDWRLEGLVVLLGALLASNHEINLACLSNFSPTWRSSPMDWIMFQRVV